jgi:hypothetical protein
VFCNGNGLLIACRKARRWRAAHPRRVSTHRDRDGRFEMKYICDAPGNRTWFRIETEAEAEQESALMDHAVASHFHRAREAAKQAYTPASRSIVEQNIGLEAHIQREMPWFLTLRNREGGGLATAMLPPHGKEDASFRPIIVGKGNADPYPEQGDAIESLGRHLGIELDRDRCFPYRR